MILKTLGTLLVLIFLVLPSFAQKMTDKEPNKNLYYEALQTYLEKNEQEYAKIFREKDFRSVIVVKNSFITKNFPNKVGNYSINFVDYDDLTQIVKKSVAKDPEAITTVVEIHPIRNKGNKLVIRFLESNARYIEKKLSLSYSDWVDVYFSFDCSKQSYSFYKVKFFGN